MSLPEGLWLALAMICAPVLWGLCVAAGLCVHDWKHTGRAFSARTQEKRCTKCGKIKDE
jgi:hypothetical protein